jgi:hypothetical protein
MTDRRRWAAWCVLVGLTACGGMKAEVAPSGVEDVGEAAGGADASVAADPIDPMNVGVATPTAPVATELTKSGFNPEGPPPRPWAELSDEDKKAYMREVVLPKMKPLMEGFDPKEFGKVTCATCHGPAGAEKRYEMPSAALHKLPKPGDAAGWARERTRHGPMLEFMGRDVTPTMARLLGKPVFDPGAGTGEFGCTACHTHVP